MCEPGQCGQDGVADAEFGEQGCGVPVGYPGGGGRGDAQACEALLELLPGGGRFRVGNVADRGQVGGADGVPGGQRVAGMDGQDPGKAEDGLLLDAGLRLAEGDPGQVHLPAVQQSKALPGGVGGAELQGDVRVPAAEGDDRLGHEVAYRNAAGGDADRAALAVAELVEGHDTQAISMVSNRKPSN